MLIKRERMDIHLRKYKTILEKQLTDSYELMWT